MAETGFMSRMATAPISWGVCEVPGWGVQLPADRVLAEMAELGFPATELGSEGYLPAEPDKLLATLKPYGLDMLAAFIPLVIHRPEEAEKALEVAKEQAALLQAVGATFFNTAPVMSWDWGTRSPLSDEEWDHALAMFGRIEEITEAHGLVQVLHPHVGIMVETKDEVLRVLNGCSVRFVLDTAHLIVGGFDPVDFVTGWSHRVGLVHIKDTDLAVADRLNAGELTLMEAVQSGIFPPVGDGDIDIDAVISRLETGGYGGWYVLEQDVAIAGPEPAVGSGPIEGVRRSVDYLRGLERRLAT